MSFASAFYISLDLYFTEGYLKSKQPLHFLEATEALTINKQAPLKGLLFNILMM